MAMTVTDAGFTWSGERLSESLCITVTLGCLRGLVESLRKLLVSLRICALFLFRGVNYCELAMSLEASMCVLQLSGGEGNSAYDESTAMASRSGGIKIERAYDYYR